MIENAGNMESGNIRLEVRNMENVRSGLTRLQSAEGGFSCLFGCWAYPALIRYRNEHVRATIGMAVCLSPRYTNPRRQSRTGQSWRLAPLVRCVIRIDVHSHLIFLDYLKYLAGRSSLPQGVLDGGTYFVSCQGGYKHASPVVHADADAKLRDMENLGIGVSVLSHGMPGPELLGGDDADDWASRINDHLASVIAQHPGKFSAWATLGWGSAERTIAEIDRCFGQLGFKGVYLFSNINQKTLDSPEFRPVFKHVARLGLTMNMHPTAPLNMNAIDQRPLVPGMAFMFDTSLATMRLVMSGMFEEEPDLKLIVPHTGGFVPYILGRVERMIDTWTSLEGWQQLSRPASDYLDKIYVDTVAHSPEALEYCYKTYGPEKLLYGTDHPFSHFNEYNSMVDNLDCTEAERQLINQGNAERLLGL